MKPSPQRVPVALVLDTDRASLRAAEEWLRSAGWTVFTAGDTAEAVRYADRLGGDLSVLVIDLGIALEDIAPVIARMRRAAPNVGVVAVGPGEVPAGLGDAQLQKPLSPAALVDAARAVVPTGCHYAVLDTVPKPDRTH